MTGWEVWGHSGKFSADWEGDVKEDKQGCLGITAGPRKQGKASFTTGCHGGDHTLLLSESGHQGIRLWTPYSLQDNLTLQRTRDIQLTAEALEGDVGDLSNL